jgi:hypothetical protein
MEYRGRRRSKAMSRRSASSRPIRSAISHIDIAQARTAQGKLHLIVAIDRTSKFVFVELHERVTRSAAVDFLRRIIEAVAYRVHTVLRHDRPVG